MHRSPIVPDTYKIKDVAQTNSEWRRRKSVNALKHATAHHEKYLNWLAKTEGSVVRVKSSKTVAAENRKAAREKEAEITKAEAHAIQVGGTLAASYHHDQ